MLSIKRAATVFPMALAVVVGCGGDDDDGPSGCNICGLDFSPRGTCTAQGRTGRVTADEVGGACVLAEESDATITLNCDNTATITSGNQSFDGTWSGSGNSVTIDFPGVSSSCTF
jgi:hypothetical protein